MASFISRKRPDYAPAYHSSLRQILADYASEPSQPLIQMANPAKIEEWLQRKNRAASSQASDLGRLASFFGFCERRGWIPENPVARVEKPRIRRSEPQILTVEECRTLLDRCPRELLAWLVLGLFAGCRPEEADRVTLANLDDGWLRVDSTMTKTRRRRVFSLHQTALDWLLHAVASGTRLAMPAATRRRFQRILRQRMNWSDWPKDILRHTAASNLLALHGDAGRVATMLGNSTPVLLQHYVGLVGVESCAAFWNLKPKENQ